MINDRRIHARTCDNWLIVRYDRAGKWFMERDTDERRQINLWTAVYHAVRTGSYVYLNQPGGKRFDAAVRRHCNQIGVAHG